MSTIQIVNDGNIMKVNSSALYDNVECDTLVCNSLDTTSLICNNLDASSINLQNDIYVSPNQSYLPVGSISIYSGQTSPNGWLLCDGSVVSRTTYSRLFSVINTVYGSGNGSTTFNLPNLQDRIPVGKMSSTTLGGTGGNNSITLSTNQLPSHTHDGTTNSDGTHSHTINDPGHSHSQNTINDDFNSSGSNPPGFAADSAGSRTWNNINSSTTGISINQNGSHTHTFTTGSTGGGESIDIRNKYIVMNYIIRY